MFFIYKHNLDNTANFGYSFEASYVFSCLREDRVAISIISTWLFSFIAKTKPYFPGGQETRPEKQIAIMCNCYLYRVLAATKADRETRQTQVKHDKIQRQIYTLK